MSKQKITLDKLIKAFEVCNRTLNPSPKTVSWYSNNLRILKEFLQKNGYSLELGKIAINEVREFIAYLWQILGHTTVERVRRYVSLASAHVTVQHRKCSPMDRINLT